jgi:hypothetical protein
MEVIQRKQFHLIFVIKKRKMEPEKLFCDDNKKEEIELIISNKFPSFILKFPCILCLSSEGESIYF